MARIIGGIGSSHTPTIGYALDARKQDDPAWMPVFEAYEPVRRWIAQRKPDAAIVVYNDHVTSFFFDHYSAFALGVGNQWHAADEGGGARDLPTLPGHAPLARHIGQSLMSAEFDLAFFQERPLDHGCFSPLSVLCPHEPEWPVSLVEGQLDQAEAVGGRAMNGEEVGVVSLVSRIGGQAVLLGCQWVDDPCIKSI